MPGIRVYKLRLLNIIRLDLSVQKVINIVISLKSDGVCNQFKDQHTPSASMRHRHFIWLQSGQVQKFMHIGDQVFVGKWFSDVLIGAKLYCDTILLLQTHGG